MGWLAVGSLGAVLGVGVRAEGAIFAIAVSAVCVAAGLRSRRWPVAASGLCFAVVAAATHLGSAMVANGITGESTGRSTLRAHSTGAISDRIDGFVTTLVSSPTASGSTAMLLLLGSLLLCSVAVLVARRGRAGQAAVLVGLAVVLWLARVVIAPDDLARGLTGAWPVVAFVAVEGWSDRTDGERRLVGIVALATLGVLATQYDMGGGLNWGARFLAPAIPMLAVLLGSTFEPMRAWSRDGRVLVGAVVALTVVTTAASVVADANVRTRTDRVVSEVAGGATSGVVVTGLDALPQLAWRTYPELQYVLVPDGEEETVHEALLHSGLQRVWVFGLSPAAFATITGRPSNENHRHEVRQVTVAAA